MIVRLPPPVDDPLFSSRAQAASYLGAWGLTATHLVLWLLITIGLLTSEALVIGVSLLSFAATCLFIGMVIAAHRGSSSTTALPPGTSPRCGCGAPGTLSAS
jgi:hypothetical protein